MKQKLLNKLWLRVGMIVAIMTTALSGTAWADTATITFANQTLGTSDGSSVYSTSTFVSSGIANSDAAFGTITCSATTKCYSGKTGHGLKAGANSSAGSFTIAFSTPLTNVTKITLNRASYSSSKTATITVKNGLTTLANAVSTPSGSADFADMDITNLSIASLSGLTVETNKYCYIKSITVTYSTGSSSAVATTTTIDDSGITNTNVHTSTEAGSLSATVKDASDNEVGGAEVTWESSNKGVATIDEDGAVTLVAEGTTTITASYAGEDGVYNSSSDTYELTVIDEDPSLTTIWSEDFSSYSKDDVPKGGTYSYVCVDGNSDTKIYEEPAAGGESPELLVNKKGTYNGSFSATIPLGDKGYVGTLKLKFKNNNTISVSAQANTGTMLKSSTSVSGNTTTGNTVSIPGVTAEMTSVTVKWSNSTSSNVRIDDIVLKGKEAPVKPSFSEDAKVFDSAFEMTISSADGTTLKYTTDGTNPASSGTAIAVDSNSKTITIPTGSNVTIKAVTISSENVSRVSTVTYTYDSRTTPSFSLSSTEVALKVNQEGSVTLTTDFDGPITVTSSNSTNMPVSYNSSTKVCTFTPSQADNYTISFSATGSENYKDAAAEVSVTVTKKSTTMVIETFFEEGLDLKTAEEGLIEGTVKYEDCALSPKPTVTYSSSDTNVATVAADGTITFKMSGSTTLKASYAGDDEYEACEAEYELSLVDTTPQETKVTIALTSTTFDTTTPNGQTIVKNRVGVTTNTGSATTPLLATDAHVRMYKNSNMVVTAPSGYYVTNIIFTEPSSSKTWDGEPTANTGTYGSKEWNGGANSVTFTFSGGQCRIASITVTLAETVTVGSAGYTTYVTKHDVEFPTGVTGYIATAINTSTVHLDEKASVPAATPIVVKAAAGTYALPAITTTPESVEGNLLRASDGSVEGDGSSYYALSTLSGTAPIGFYQVEEDVTIPAGKAYLVDGAGVKGFTFDFDDDATAIEKTLSDSPLKGENIYNLAGQRLGNSQLKRGIYIVNGKKVMVK